MRSDAIEPLTIFAPGSLMLVRDAILEGFARAAPDIPARFHPPAYSGLLADQIRQGAPADVFISANLDFLEELREDGFVPEPRPLARNRLCIIARPGLAPALHGIADLGRAGLRLVVPPAARDPLGRYTVMLFERAGMSQIIAEKRQRGEIRHELASFRDWLDRDEVDAGVVYVNTVPMFGDGSELIPLPEPYDLRDRVVFGVGAVRREGVEHPAAGAFVGYLFSAAGQRTLIDAGFLPLNS